MRAATVAGLAAALTLVCAGAAHAQTLERIDSETFWRPSYVTSDPTDADRLFVVEQRGTIQQVTPQGRGAAPYLDISERVRIDSEQGMASIALAPDFATSGHFYVAYVRGTEADDVPPLPGEHNLVISEFTGGATAADPASERVLLELDHPFEQSNDGAGQHYGGQLQFGPDGLLYISTGDGSGGQDLEDNAQDPESLFGKLLRVDPRPSGGLPYTVPADNPFVGDDGVADEIWAIGFRNPWRFSFDRYTGEMWIADVGEKQREEIDFAGSVTDGGQNFGWSCREGSVLFVPTPPGTPSYCPSPEPESVPPWFEYPHNALVEGDFEGCSVIGGYVVRDPGLPQLFGRYLFSDFCAKQVMSIDPASTELDSDLQPTGLTPTPPLSRPSSFGEDACGRVYLAEIVSPEHVWRIAPDANPAPHACTLRTLTVQVTGDGRVTGPGLDCPGDCTAAVYDARTVELAAAADPGADMTGWGGDCGHATGGSCAIRVIGGDAWVSAGFTETPKAPTTIRLRAKQRKVVAGKRARLKAKVRPCAGRLGGDVNLRDRGETIKTSELNDSCVVRFRPRLRSKAGFRATIAADEAYLAARSKRVTVKVEPRRR